MLSGLVFLAFASLAGSAPSAVAHAGQQQGEIRSSCMAPAESQSSIASESDPSDFEEEQEDGKRHAPESAWALTSAISGKTLFSWLDAPRGEPSPQAQRFEIALGMPRGPPARG